MAGYFEYLGRVFTEKGSWYKILTIIVLQGLAMLFSPKLMFNNMSPNSMPEINIPGIILYLLVATLIFGFVIQIFNGAMNNKPKLLPDIDFLDMFIKSVRLIPFWLVWMIYLGVFGAFVGFTLPSLARGGGAVAVLFVALFAIFWIFLAFMLVVLLIIHSKSFSYKYVLNPLTPFKICPKIIAPMLALIFLYGIMNIVLYALLFAAGVLLGISGGSETTVTTKVAFVGLIVIWLYFYNAFSFAYNLKFADIVKEKLDDTEYLDSDYDLSVVEEDEE